MLLLRNKFGHWFVPNDHYGDAMMYWILTENEKMITWSTIHPTNDPNTLNFNQNARIFISEFTFRDYFNLFVVGRFDLIPNGVILA